MIDLARIGLSGSGDLICSAGDGQLVIVGRTEVRHPLLQGGFFDPNGTLSVA